MIKWNVRFCFSLFETSQLFSSEVFWSALNCFADRIEIMKFISLINPQEKFEVFIIFSNFAFIYKAIHAFNAIRCQTEREFSGATVSQIKYHSFDGKVCTLQFEWIKVLKKSLHSFKNMWTSTQFNNWAVQIKWQALEVHCKFSLYARWSLLELRSIEWFANVKQDFGQDSATHSDEEGLQELNRELKTEWKVEISAENLM